MTATAIGFSPWDLYGPCECGAAEGQPCRTGLTGAARLVVHHSRRPVDDVTGAGFTPVLTRAERVLLARVHRWARQILPGTTATPRWERSYLPSWWTRKTAPLAEVSWGATNDGRLTVQVRASRYGEQLLDETVTPRTVREAVDLLVAWRILPLEFSSAYTAAVVEAVLQS